LAQGGAPGSAFFRNRIAPARNDADGWIGPAASVHGWHLLVQLLEHEPGLVGELVDQGYTEDPKATAHDAWLEGHPAVDKDNRSTIENLVKLLPKCDAIGIISSAHSE